MHGHRGVVACGRPDSAPRSGARHPGPGVRHPESGVRSPGASSCRGEADHGLGRGLGHGLRLGIPASSAFPAFSGKRWSAD